jgi:hypothetical protein
VAVNRAGRADLRLASATSRPSEKATPEDGPHAESLRRLARLLEAHAPYDGAFPLRVPGLHVVLRSARPCQVSPRSSCACPLARTGWPKVLSHREEKTGNPTRARGTPIATVGSSECDRPTLGNSDRRST